MTCDELHLAYISQLSPGCDYSVFSGICRGARARNVERGVAGVLLFDGQRFFQWLYGTRADVTALMHTLQADSRHERIDVHFEALLPPLGHEPHWRAGFVEPDALDAFAALDRAQAATVLEGVARLVQQADLEPPLLVTTLRDARAGVGKAPGPVA